VGQPAAADVVLVRFPFSDLSDTKVRPALVLADAGRGDLVLCQITSRPYGDARAEPLTASDFAAGGLPVDSWVRPAKLFTAHLDLVHVTMGVLQLDAHRRIVEAIVRFLHDGGVSTPPKHAG
jgi:mRNA interferase MazF